MTETLNDNQPTVKKCIQPTQGTSLLRKANKGREHQYVNASTNFRINEINETKSENEFSINEINEFVFVYVDAFNCINFDW